MAIDLAAAIAAQQQQWEAERAAWNAERAAEEAERARKNAEERARLLPQFMGDELFAQLQPEPDEHGRYTFIFEGVRYFVSVWANRAELLSAGTGIGFCTLDEFVKALAAVHTQSKAETERARAKAELRAAQLATHAQLAERVNEATAAAPRWQWPEGREITIFRWQWCTAPASEYGSAEYDGGWSMFGTLGVLLKLGAERSRGERDLYLAPSCMPVSSRIPIACLGDLPPDLREPDLLIIPGIRYDYEAQDLDGDPILVAEPFGELKVQLGQRPVAWVRALLEADQ